MTAPVWYILYKTLWCHHFSALAAKHFDASGNQWLGTEIELATVRAHLLGLSQIFLTPPLLWKQPFAVVATTSRPCRSLALASALPYSRRCCQVPRRLSCAR